MKNGFVTLLSLLIITLLIGIWFAKMYATPVSNPNSENPEVKETRVETYHNAVNKATDIKKVLESKNLAE